MKYSATIHTTEIQPSLPEGMMPYDWIKQAYSVNHPCVSRIWRDRNSGGMPRLIINPHRLQTTSDGKYIFAYDGLKIYQKNMRQIAEALNMDGYIIHRLDICLDCDQPYEATAKATRFIALLLGEQINAVNRYFSVDPLTMKLKTLRLSNGKETKYATAEIEHYNRALIDQTDYAGNPIMNRLELRSMGKLAGIRFSEEDIAERWIERFDSIDNKLIDAVETRLAEMLFGEWKRFSEGIKKPTSTAFYSFLRAHAQHIYTHAELEKLLVLYGSTKVKADAESVLRGYRGVFSLIRAKQLKTEVAEMKAAIRAFTAS